MPKNDLIFYPVVCIFSSDIFDSRLVEPLRDGFESLLKYGVPGSDLLTFDDYLLFSPLKAVSDRSLLFKADDLLLILLFYAIKLGVGL